MFEKTNMVVVKLTRDCNLRCKYCYIKNKDQFKGELMDFSIFKRIVDKIIVEKTNTGFKNKISLVLHGGEPTLMSPKEISRFLSYAKRMFEEHKIPYSFSMQTNATRLDEDMLMVLHDFDVNVGISFDGVEKSNSLRTDKSTVFYEDTVKKLNDYNVRFGALMVVNPVNIDFISQNIEYMYNVLGLKGYKINPAEDVLSIGGCEVYGKDFFEKVLKNILEDASFNKTSIRESNLNKIINDYFISRFFNTSMADFSSGNCSVKVCGGGIGVIEINPDGSANLCGRYSEDFEDVALSNIFDKDFLSLHNIHMYFNMVKSKHKAILDAGCDLCYADDICDHGCMAFHMDKYGEWGIRKDLVCEIYKPLKKYIAKNELKIFSLMFNNKITNNVLYLNARKEITHDNIELINKIIGKEYIIEPDYNFKINGEKQEGKTYQVKITKRENELYNNKELQ